jgi:TldD protein
MKYDLSKFSDFFSGYTELRIQENVIVRIVLVNGDVTINTFKMKSGVSARVFKNGAWGFASIPETGDDKIKYTIKKASGNSTVLNQKSKSHIYALPEIKAESENSFFTTKPKVTHQDKINFIKEIDSYIIKKYPDLTARSVVLNTLDMEKSLLTSNGSKSYSMIPRAGIIVVLTKEKNGEPVRLSEYIGTLGQFEDNFNDMSMIYNKIDDLYEKLMDKTDGVFAEPGIKECILDADLAGILAHEAIGHTTEADIVIGGSIAGNFMDKQVASPLITLIDFANNAFGKTCPVPVYIDDEGTKAEDAIIIENGILKSFMHNKQTSVMFDAKPTGNARAFGFYDEPLIRMRNTAIVPGKARFNDMIASIDDGYYLIKNSNGQADSTSEFTFGVTLGYKIKNGKISSAIKDTTISGIAFDVLRSVSMVSDDMVWSNGGMCGKKQPIPVSFGGPAIKCKVNIGGR